MATGVLMACLKDAVADREMRARKAMQAHDSLKDKDTPYAKELLELAHVHDAAAGVYRSAYVKAKG